MGDVTLTTDISVLSYQFSLSSFDV